MFMAEDIPRFKPPECNGENRDRKWRLKWPLVTTGGVQRAI
jgi:hypothetical protein